MGINKEHYIGEDMRKRILPFLGAVQVQYTNAMMYVSVGSVTMAALTFWAVAGTSILGSVFPWMGAREFLGLVAIGLICVMILDRKVMYRHRLSFLNNQAYNANVNPAKDNLLQIIDDVAALKSDIEKIKTALGIIDAE